MLVVLVLNLLLIVLRQWISFRKGVVLLQHSLPSEGMHFHLFVAIAGIHDARRPAETDRPTDLPRTAIVNMDVTDGWMGFGPTLNQAI